MPISRLPHALMLGPGTNLQKPRFPETFLAAFPQAPAPLAYP